LSLDLCNHGRDPLRMSQGLQPVVLRGFNSRVACVVAFERVTA
jgi:hypothetical protein